jgi:DNA-binding transcriptional ArsR family regulator
LRSHILTILNEQVASPNEIAQMIDERLPNVSYHVRALQDLECIELVRTAQRRGAVEHYYRAVKRPFFSARDWKRLPHSARQAITDLGLRLIWDDACDAIRGGTFDRRVDRHMSRSPLALDEQGWTEVTALLAKVLSKTEDIAVESAKRLARSKEREISTRLVMLHFESPDIQGR